MKAKQKQLNSEPYSAGLPGNFESRKATGHAMPQRNPREKSILESHRKVSKNFVDYKPYQIDLKMRKLNDRMREDESVRLSSANFYKISSANSDSFLVNTNNVSNSKQRQMEDGS